MTSHSHFQGNRILAVQQRQLVVKFDVYLHRKNMPNLWCCLFSYSVSTFAQLVAMPFLIHLGFFSNPSFPLQLLTLIFHPIFFPQLLFSVSLSLYLPSSPLLLVEQYLVPLSPWKPI